MPRSASCSSPERPASSASIWSARLPQTAGQYAPPPAILRRSQRRQALSASPCPTSRANADWAPLVDGATHILHLAGIAHAPGHLPEDVYNRINRDVVGELAGAARGCVERFVLMSTVRAQAGLAADHVITEADPPLPTDAYGRSKLEAEQLLAGSGVPFSVLRPAVVYGRGVKGNIASLATLAQTPMPLPFGGLDNRRSLLAIDNLASAIELALTSPKAEGEMFLVADTRADQRRRPRHRHARRAWPPPTFVARADRRGEAADGDLRQGEGVGAAVGKFRHRRREAPRDRLGPSHQDLRRHRRHDARAQGRRFRLTPRLRHALPCAGHPRISSCKREDVDGRDKPDHDEIILVARESGRERRSPCR